ncbi:anaphase-promoting complex subunit 5 isoform X2 [Cynara cardunculus var. scolymus]|uniref:anaphase-promoting complex subunit 5 isoform X2 n=1 Tax=Cynara cardunculus var. scolymus TaxID=59895 RepID=UPI000D6255E9|nr:anaphase-promoting complex subunit 5 isoform X2 [Cynara cardunculus var. scolymus]
MAGILKPQSGFVITPHKVSICILLQVYAPSGQYSVPFPFASVSQHNRLGLFLIALTKSCDDILEPTLDEFLKLLKEFGGLLDNWLSDHVTGRLSSLSSPDDLFTFFSELRGILAGPETSIVDDDQINLDPNSNLGMYLRRCLLAFNILSFEGMCHLLTNIKTYCKEAFSCPPYEMSHLDDPTNDLEAPVEYENMDLENFVLQNFTEELESRKRSTERVPFHNHSSKALSSLIEDIMVSPGQKGKHNHRSAESSQYMSSPTSALPNAEPSDVILQRTNWQIQGYLSEQADMIEKLGSSFPMSAFESVLKLLQKVAPELHRVHFLRYLNSLYHDDYPAALENLHRYFDYSAGMEGSDFVPTSFGCTSFGRYEIALLSLGMAHFHFGHPKLALEVLTEAVRVCQQHSDDTCLAYTLTAICNLLSEVGISNMTGIMGTSDSQMTSIGTSLSVQQQLFVLLRRSLKRADSLKLKRLVASNHLAMAKFDLTHVQRPLLSFGPKASIQLRTCPTNVCKKLRLSSQLIHQFDNESSVMTIDGALSTSWLKNQRKPTTSLVFPPESGSESNCDTFYSWLQSSSVPGSVLQLVGSSYLVRVTSWELYGSASLARSNSLLFATCFADSSSSADLALAYGKLIQHLAVYKGYKEAFVALKIAEAKFLSISKSGILPVKLQLLHERALHRGHLKLAQQICDELGVLASSVAGVDMELKTEASLRCARTLLAANQFSQAASVAHSLFCKCYKFNLHVENATVLLLLAEIHKRSGNAVLGIPYALASLSFCQSFNLDLLRASATLTLAELWLLLGSRHAKRALNLIHGAFPIILGQGGLELQSRAYIAEAKCYLSDMSISVSEDPDIVLDSLRQACEGLDALEYHELAAEAYYLMAVVLDTSGQIEQRDEAASRFKQHIIVLENPVKPEDPLLNLL